MYNLWKLMVKYPKLNIYLSSNIELLGFIKRISIRIKYETCKLSEGS